VSHDPHPGRMDALAAPMNPIRAVVLTLLLAALSVAGNHFNLSLFFGLQLIFGSVAVLLAIAWLGTRAGLVVAAASGAYTYVLWDHPFALVICLAEAAFVGWHRDHARRRGREFPALGFSVALYWVLIGIPLVLLFYHLVMGMIWQQTLLVAIKQSLNGILNAALAGLVLMTVATLRHRPGSLSARQVLFSLLLSGILLPAILVVAWENRDLKERLEKDLGEHLRIFGTLVVHNRDPSAAGGYVDQSEILAQVREITRHSGATLFEGAGLEVQVMPPRGEPAPVPGEPGARFGRTADDDMVILLPDDWQPSRMSLWRQARYRMTLPLSDPRQGETLVIELDAAPLVDQLHQVVQRLLAILLVIAGIGILLADRLSRLLVRPLHQLVEAAGTLPTRIVSGEALSIPPPGLLAEGRALTDAFGVMARGLTDSFATVKREREVQSRLRAIRDLQARMLEGLLQFDEDERAAAELLCRLVEGIVPSYRCTLLRPLPTGGCGCFASHRLGEDQRADLERCFSQPGFCDASGASEPDGRVFVVDLAPHAPRPEETHGSARDTAALWWCAPVIGHEGHQLGILSIGPCGSRESEAFVQEVLETAASLAALAFDTLRTRRRHLVLIDALSRAGTGIIIARRTATGDFRISYVNQGFEALTGYRADEVKGLNCRFLQDDDRDQPERLKIRAALAAGEPCQATIRNYRKDGTLFWNALNLAPLVDSTGEVTHYVGIQQDLTSVHETLERLAVSEASLREAQATAQLGSWDLDCRRGQVRWSEETYRLLGYEPNSVSPSLDAFYVIVHPDDEAGLRAEWEAAWGRPDGHLAIEHRILRRDGAQRVLRQQGRAYRADDGTPLRFAGTTQDITAQRAVEDALRVQEERYRLVVENMEDLVVRTDTEGRFEYVSPSYSTLFGLDPGDLVGQHYLPLVHPEDQASTEEAVRALSMPPFTCLIEQQARTIKGWRWLQWADRAVLDEAGAVRAIVAVGRDITARKEIEITLAEERRRLSDIIDATWVGTWEFDLITNALILNARWAEMIGHRPEDLAPTTIGTWRDFCHPEDLVRSDAEVARHLAGETDRYFCEVRMRHHDGHWIWVRDQGRVSARDQDGRPLRMAGIHEDITSRKQAELDLIQREALERELLELTSAFVQVHDENLDPLINQTLARVGSLTGSDRAYVFGFDLATDTMSNSHEWVAAGVEPMIKELQQHPIEHYSASIQALEKGEAVVIPQVADLPSEWAAEREILESQSIQSLVLVPLLRDNRLNGFVGFDAVHQERDWSGAEVRFLRVLASILVSALERARTYAALRESNSRYDQLALQSRSVAWEVDARGLFTYLSPAVEPVWGYRPEELVGRKHFFDLMPAADQNRLKAEAFQAFERRLHLIDFANPIRRGDGKTIWVLTNGLPILAGDGTLLGYRGTDIDITARHLAQEQLKDSEARLSAIFENAPIGIAMAGPNRRLTLANRMLGAFLGYAPQDLIGMRFDEFSHPEDLAAEFALFEEMVAGKRDAYRFPKRYRKADGSIVWGDLRVVLLPGASGGRPMSLGMVEDITEFQATTERRRELEAVLLRYTKHLEALVDLASKALSSDEEVLALLRLGCSGLGMDAGEIDAILADTTYRPVARYPETDALRAWPGPDITRDLESVNAVPGIPHLLAGAGLPASAREAGYGCCVLMALSWTGPDGRVSTRMIRFWGGTERAELSGPDRELVRLIGQRIVAQQFEEQLRKALVSAKERETIGHLASGVAHDFNNLLGVIDANLYYLQAILSADQADPEIAQVMEETQSALGQAKVVTSGMLSLSRAGGIVLEEVPLEKTIGELVTILRQILSAKVRLRLDIQPGLVARSNAAFLQAALLNLVLNARDAMPDGGDLGLEARTTEWDERSPLAVGRLATGTYAQVRVVDTGCGMNQEVLARLFEPLFSTKAKQRGHGLGMFMVQGFVTRSGAGLAVTSRAGEGTEFRLLMPLGGQNPQDIDRPNRREQLRLRQHRLDGFILQVRRVAVLVQDAFHHHPNSGPGAFAQGPVDGHALAHLGDQLGGDDLELVVAHGDDGGFIGGEGVVKGDLVVGQAQSSPRLVAASRFPWRV
jgi:PAS domain S-box-containing protein